MYIYIYIYIKQNHLSVLRPEKCNIKCKPVV